MSVQVRDLALARRCIDALEMLRGWGYAPIEALEPVGDLLAPDAGCGEFGGLRRVAYLSRDAAGRDVLGAVHLEAAVESSGPAGLTFVESLVAACETAGVLGASRVAVRLSDVRVLRAMLAKRGYGYRLARLIEQNVAALENDLAREKLVAMFESERADPQTEAFLERYQSVTDEIGGEKQVVELFEGLLSMLDIQTYDRGIDLSDFVRRLVERASYQRDCRDAASFLAELRALSEKRASFDECDELRKTVNEFGGDEGAAIFDQLVEAATQVWNLMGGRVDLILEAIPGASIERSVGPSFELRCGSLAIGSGGAVEAEQGESAVGEAAATAAAVFQISVDEIRTEAVADDIRCEQLSDAMSGFASRLRIVPLGEANRAYALRIWRSFTNRLDWPGLAVELETSGRSLKKALAQAVGDGMTHVAILGDDERSGGTITLKRLSDEEQATLDGDAAAALRAFLALEVAEGAAK